LTFLSGTANNQANMSFSGSVAAINAALDGLANGTSLSQEGLQTLHGIEKEQGKSAKVFETHHANTLLLNHVRYFFVRFLRVWHAMSCIEVR